jgi:hypothetical protein
MEAFENETAVNNYICIELRKQGLPTNMHNRARLIKELSSEFNCDMFNKVSTYYAANY